MFSYLTKFISYQSSLEQWLDLLPQFQIYQGPCSQMCSCVCHCTWNEKEFDMGKRFFFSPSRPYRIILEYPIFISFCPGKEIFRTHLCNGQKRRRHLQANPVRPTFFLQSVWEQRFWSILLFSSSVASSFTCKIGLEVTNPLLLGKLRRETRLLPLNTS